MVVKRPEIGLWFVLVSRNATTHLYLHKQGERRVTFQLAVDCDVIIVVHSFPFEFICRVEGCLQAQPHFSISPQEKL